MLAGPFAIGAAGDPLVLLSNKLAGWFHQGVVLRTWRPEALGAGLFWEWLPALLFGAGLAGLLLAPPEPRRRLTSRVGGFRAVCRLVPWLCVTWPAIAGTVIAVTCFGGIPHVQDSIAQQFQAQIFARARAYAPEPAAAEFLSGEFLVLWDGRWFAQYPPLHAALLAVGTLLGAPWLINPLLAAGTAVLLHGAIRSAGGTRVASRASGLFALSPFVWFMAGERMNHVTALLFITLSLWAVAPGLGRLPRRLGPGRVALSGLALGLAVSTRPLCAVSAAGPFIILAAIRHSSLQRLSAHLVPLALGVLAGVVPLLLFNALTTGSPWISGYEAQWGNSGWGFGRSQWGPPHTPQAGLLHTASNWDALGKYLFEWPIPSTLVLLWSRPWRGPWLERAAAASVLGVTLAYMPYFFQDLCLGPRFLFAALPGLLILSAAGLQRLTHWTARRAATSRREALARVRLAWALVAGVGLATNLPILWKWYSSSFWGTGFEVVDAVRRAGIQRGVVFIRDHNRARAVELRLRGVSVRTAHGAVEMLDERWIDGRIAAVDADPRGNAPARLERQLAAAIASRNPVHLRRTLPWIDYRGRSSSLSHGLWANTPWPEEQAVLYALHLGERNAHLLRAYPGRPAWVYDFDPTVGRFALSPWRSQITSR